MPVVWAPGICVRVAELGAGLPNSTATIASPTCSVKVFNSVQLLCPRQSGDHDDAWRQVQPSHAFSDHQHTYEALQYTSNLFSQETGSGCACG